MISPGFESKHLFLGANYRYIDLNRWTVKHLIGHFNDNNEHELSFPNSNHHYEEWGTFTINFTCFYFWLSSVELLPWSEKLTKSNLVGDEVGGVVGCFRIRPIVFPSIMSSNHGVEIEWMEVGKTLVTRIEEGRTLTLWPNWTIARWCRKQWLWNDGSMARKRVILFLNAATLFCVASSPSIPYINSKSQPSISHQWSSMPMNNNFQISNRNFSAEASWFIQTGVDLLIIILFTYILYPMSTVNLLIKCTMQQCM